MKDTVTLRDVYDVVNRLESKMDRKWEEQEKINDELKSNQSRAIGALSVISIFAGGLSAYVWDRILGRN